VNARISSFYGIVIAMYYNDHAPPHFHAIHGDNEALISIASREPIGGALPRRALRLVQEWVDLHQRELLANWEQARRGLPLDNIEPLP
jgi:hypothetical protein